MADGLTKQEKRERVKEKKKKEKAKREFSSKIQKWGIIVLILGVVFYFGYKAYAYFTAPLPEVATAPIQVADTDHVKGAEDAAVTLVEYGDFECPACAFYAPIVKSLSDSYPDRLRVVFRHFPLPSHTNAYEAALAAEAAGKQGKFWEMHDVLYEKQEEWSKNSNPQGKFEEYASQLELDLEKFKKDMETDDLKEKVDNDVLSGNSLKVSFTPSFFLDGQLVQPRSLDEFKKLIDNMLKESN